MNKINYTIVILAIVSIVELIITKNMEATFWLWVGYGLYRYWND